MIGYLSGVILSMDDQTVLVDVNGVGYEVFVGNTAAVRPGEVGGRIVLWIVTYVREDQITLFGFKEMMSKQVFNILIGITGIGPKLAMSVLSSLSPAELVEAVTVGDLRVLRGVPGVGKKMAERMVLELKDKLGALLKEADWSTTTGGENLAVWRDLSDALVGLGFSEQDIRNVIKSLKTEFGGSPPELSQLIKLGLQKINA
ncbi:MAG: Holliday junction branch migration protein RuvA [Acidobacteriota bacterium]|nr:Holliday junction branch migration protein RuvA [Acidobacteriota bacterium]